MVKKIPFLLIAAILFFLCPLGSFSQQADYFSNRLIVKYESDRELQQIRSKTKADPKNAVQQVLTKNGARKSRPLLPERMRQSIRRQSLPSSDDVLRIQEVVFNRNINPVQLAAKISKMPGVAYAEPKYIRSMNLTPNDQLEKFVDAHNFTDAWDLSKGSSEVVIAVVDGGVGYTHDDLDDKLWVNQDEVPPTVKPQADQNSDGTVTSTEIKQYLNDNNADNNADGSITLEDALHEDSSFMDNVDADNNSFTDDLFGWDFWAAGGVDSPVITDNNPFHDATDHGTHVTGIAAAETDNGIGVAGAGFNSSYMAIKAGGIPDDPSTPDTDESRAIGFGFEGIVYAAEQGADVINCSWGGPSASEAEQDIINLATEMGALVVAASGNATANQVGFPSGYDKVLSVGSVEPSGIIASYSNYGYRLDVLTTGSAIESTSFNNSLTSKSGTSMSTPVASGLAALVKTLHPSWSAERIGTQIRASATSIDGSNTDEVFDSRLGGGSADAFNALNTNLPGLKVVSQKFVDADGNKLGLNQPGSVQLELTNLGNTTSGLELELISLNEGGLEIGANTQQLGSISTGDTVSVSFDLTILDEFNLSETPTLRLNFRDQSQNYGDYNIIQYEKILYDIVAINNVKTSLAGDGTIGFTNPLNGTGGVGFIPRTPDGTGGFQEGENLLFEGGLILQIEGQIYDAVRTENGVSRDFTPEQVFASQTDNSGNSNTGSARFVVDTDTAGQAVIDLETFSFSEPALSNVVFLKYTIQNPTEFLVMNDVYIGLFNDWDIGSNASNNNLSYSETDSLLYVSDATSPGTNPVTAVAHLSPVSGALAINNAVEGQPDSVTFGIYDGFTDAEKSEALTSGTARTNVQGVDASAVVASGPYTINPGAQITVGFVYAFGDDASQLRNQIAEARSRNLFAVSPTGRAASDEVPRQTELFQNYPNPFNNSTQIRIDLQQATDVTLTIYNVLGQKVRTLANRRFDAGSHFIRFNASNLSSGIYFARLNTKQGAKTIPMTLVK